MASGHVNRENRPNTWLHPTGICDVKIFLANSEPSTQLIKEVRTMAVSGGIADLERTSLNRRD
jgi:hypothetical protein